ncbi:MAG TPA: hypothetical protein VFG69_11520, partial [Nannocystaceae bacterium]|nr:hypothetical protein [Nannocystaceae bacterium]
MQRLELTIVAGACALLLLGLAARAPEADAGPESSTTELAAASAPSGYASLLAAIDLRIASLQARADDRPGDWLTRMHLGTALF